MPTLKRAETERTQWRGDGTLPGIMAKIEDGGRELGAWVGDPGQYGYRGDGVTLYVKGRNGQTTASWWLTPTETRALIASLSAMVEMVDRNHPPS